jgi:hypothetical protein
VTDRFSTAAGTVGFDTPAYLDFLDREYLTPYVGHGGGAVKLLVAEDDATTEALAAGLAGTVNERAGGFGEGFLSVGVDAVTTRIHLIDQVFAELARQLDWLALAGSVVHLAYVEAGFPPPEAPPSLSPSPSPGASSLPGSRQLTVAAVARHHGVDSAELLPQRAPCPGTAGPAPAGSVTSSGRPCSGCASITWAEATSAGPSARR